MAGEVGMGQVLGGGDKQQAGCSQVELSTMKGIKVGHLFRLVQEGLSEEVRLALPG